METKKVISFAELYQIAKKALDEREPLPILIGFVSIEERRKVYYERHKAFYRRYHKAFGLCLMDIRCLTFRAEPFRYYFQYKTDIPFFYYQMLPHGGAMWKTL